MMQSQMIERKKCGTADFREVEESNFLQFRCGQNLLLHNAREIIIYIRGKRWSSDLPSHTEEC